MSNNNNKKNKYVIEESPYKINGKQYIIWLLFGGFIAVANLFFLSALLICTIVGVGMSTQIYNLASYVFSGADVHVEPNRDAAKVQNWIWAILFGWMFYLGAMLMYYIYYITYFGRKIGMKWKELSKLMLFPFGVDVTVRE